jgi:hypothetical protein
VRPAVGELRRGPLDVRATVEVALAGGPAHVVGGEVGAVGARVAPWSLVGSAKGARGRTDLSARGFRGL